MPDAKDPPQEAPTTTQLPDEDLRALAPFQHPVFTMLWSTWLVANLCMWMNDVAAAWLMSQLATTPVWVALVQTAATLPVFLLGLPSGALADILDRKRFLLVTQLWVAVVGSVLALAVFAGVVTPPILLALVFLNGVGLALRWPVFSAIVPELVPRAKLPAALALNGVSMNASRILGPLLAGGIIASLGSAWVFLLNAALSILAAFIITRWKRERRPNPLGRERLGSAMRVGLQYVIQSYHLQGVLLRIAVFFFHGTALMALLPLVAQNMENGGAGTFTWLLAAMGAGAIAVSMQLPRLRQWLPRDRLVLAGTALQGLCMVVMAFAYPVWMGLLAMMVSGAAWLATANALSVSAQMSLPDWVRARGMSMFQMAIMGAAAAGAAVWGQVATLTSVPTALVASGVSTVLVMALVGWRVPDRGMLEDPTPHGTDVEPEVRMPPASGRVLATVEFIIDPAKTQRFLLVMELSRRSRLRQGALSWELLSDANDPRRFVEAIEDNSWPDHLRRLQRATASDIRLRERKLAFHVGEEPPVVRRMVRQSTVRESPVRSGSGLRR